MPPRVRAALALALLAAPGLAGAAAGTTAGASVQWVLAPEAAPGDGEALAARAALQGPPGARLEVRARLAGPGLAGAQAWDGAAWQRADRYHLAWDLDAAGHAEGWIAVRAADMGPGPWILHVRARDAADRIVGEAEHALVAPSGEPRMGTAPGPLVGAWLGERLVALAPVHPFAAAGAPWDVPGRYALRAPPDAMLRRVALDGSPGEPVEATPPGDLRIAALLVDPSGPDEAEFVRVANHAPQPMDLTGWHLEGPGWRAVARSGVLAPGGTATFARNATAYEALTGRHDALRDVSLAGPWQLPNGAGSVALGRWGAPVDAVAWGGGGPAPEPGMLLRRDAGGWDPSPWRAAWGERAAMTAEAEVAAFTTNEAFEVATAALATAQDEVLVATYTFTHPGLAAPLHAALGRGARVALLVEGAPVGGVPHGEAALLAGLAAAGAEVHRIGGSGRDRYDTMHAKYAVLDGATLLLGSENWTPSGFPEAGPGNVGWGALVRDPALGQHFRDVWREDADAARGDVRPWPSHDAWTPRAPRAGALPAMAAARATALLVPDNARPEVLGLLARAELTIELEALQLPVRWGGGPNPVLDALHDAARRGVRVRALLDGAPGTENAAAVEEMAGWSREEGLAAEARLSRDARVHNKGIIVDGTEALVGSINLGEASMTRNREAALLVAGLPVEVWAAAFEADWHAAGPEQPASLEPHVVAAPLAAVLVAGAVRARVRRR